ncbi:flagellar basal body P-ring formation chaperone FlgA [Arenibaculum pallidiluteum]|uniref:flagellar basal body P-ring formation chaperone FlgA n=1 Tax=Arenibaculum pallidiluteum TaxID=2812559 RepID=UPI001A95DB57|nr:flagellar basal body P-ring formation chaperone FlgA [Arenibaculum pallidiluteum]
MPCIRRRGATLVPRRSAALVPILALALQAPLASPAQAAAVEELLATEVAATLGPAMPSEARVSVRLALPFPGPAQAVRDLRYDPRTGQFQAVVASGERLFDVGGSAEIEVDVPVPTRRLLPGEVIGEGDLAVVPMPVDRLSATTLTDRATLVGQAARRQLSPGRIIMRGSVGAPIVVERNKPVVLVYEDGALHLAAQGRALQDGGVGDTVRVMNAASRGVVTGTVTGPERVAVKP